MDMHKVTFIWPEVDAENVIVTGSFDHWSSSVHLAKTPRGFEGQVMLPWGERVPYKFVVDGRWTTAQSQPEEQDGHGNINNVYECPTRPEPAVDKTSHSDMEVHEDHEIRDSTSIAATPVTKRDALGEALSEELQQEDATVTTVGGTFSGSESSVPRQTQDPEANGHVQPVVVEAAQYSTKIDTVVLSDLRKELVNGTVTSEEVTASDPLSVDNVPVEASTSTHDAHANGTVELTESKQRSQQDLTSFDTESAPAASNPPSAGITVSGEEKPAGDESAVVFHLPVKDNAVVTSLEEPTVVHDIKQTPDNDCSEPAVMVPDQEDSSVARPVDHIPNSGSSDVDAATSQEISSSLPRAPARNEIITDERSPPVGLPTSSEADVRVNDTSSMNVPPVIAGTGPVTTVQTAPEDVAVATKDVSSAANEKRVSVSVPKDTGDFGSSHVFPSETSPTPSNFGSTRKKRRSIFGKVKQLFSMEKEEKVAKEKK